MDGAVAGHVEQERVPARRSEQRDGDMELSLLQLQRLAVPLERDDARACSASFGAAPLGRPLALPEAVAELVAVTGRHRQVSLEVARANLWHGRAEEAHGAGRRLQLPPFARTAVGQVASVAALVARGAAAPDAVVDPPAGGHHLGEALRRSRRAAEVAVKLGGGAGAGRLSLDRPPAAVRAGRAAIEHERRRRAEEECARVGAAERERAIVADGDGEVAVGDRRAGCRDERGARAAGLNQRSREVGQVLGGERPCECGTGGLRGGRQ
mmetsp:Transcript_35661/g.119192  ORF Transcript_35661/g.119192 Transcript_35661/m.119192 type:complete len:268 (+) Transcript_35661:788-1591(+)